MTRSVLISGATGAIGSALCHELAASGYRPIIGYKTNEQKARSLAHEVVGGHAHLDLSDDITIERTIEYLSQGEQPLAGVILAASPPPVILPLFKIPDSEFTDQWRVNVDGSRKLLAGVVRQCMRPQKKGWVVGILSQAMGLSGMAAKSMGAYIIAKYGLSGLLKSLEAEYSWLNVLSVSPDFTESGMLDAFDDRFLNQLRAQKTEGRFALPKEIAREIMSKISEFQ